MNQKYIWFLVVIAIIIGGMYFFNIYKKTDDKTETKQVEVSEGDLVTKELADKYQAMIGWEEDLTYTLQAQEKLTAGKSVIFKGYLDDIFNRDGKTYVRLLSSYLSTTDFVLEIECEREKINQIIASQKGEKDYLGYFYDDFVVVANIQEVSKSVFELKGSALSEEEVEIEIEPSKHFVAKGTCLEIVYVGEKNEK